MADPVFNPGCTPTPIVVTSEFMVERSTPTMQAQVARAVNPTPIKKRSIRATNVPLEYAEAVREHFARSFGGATAMEYVTANGSRIRVRFAGNLRIVQNTHRSATLSVDLEEVRV